MLAGWTVVDFPSSTYLDGMGIASTSGLVTLWVDDLTKILGDNASWGATLSAGIEQQRQDGPITTPITDAELSPKLDRRGRAPVRRSVQLTLNSCGPRLPARGPQSVCGRRPALLLARCPLPSDVPDVAGQDLFDALAVAGGEVIHDGVVLGG